MCRVEDYDPVTEAEILVEQVSPQGVLVCDHAVIRCGRGEWPRDQQRHLLQNPRDLRHLPRERERE